MDIRVGHVTSGQVHVVGARVVGHGGVVGHSVGAGQVGHVGGGRVVGGGGGVGHVGQVRHVEQGATENRTDPLYHVPFMTVPYSLWI